MQSCLDKLAQEKQESDLAPWIALKLNPALVDKVEGEEGGRG